MTPLATSIASSSESHRDQRRHRAEDLFLGDAHVALHVAEDRRLVEVAVPRAPVVRRSPADQPACAPSCSPICDILHGPSPTGRWLIDGPICDCPVQAVADAQLSRAPCQSARELVCDRAVDDHPAGRRAALAGRAEGAPQRAVDGQIQVGVFHAR